MAFCQQQQERVEEEVLQPVDRWVDRQEERCRNEPCNWWMLCINQLVCWLVWVSVKVAEWVLVIVVRWVYRIVCIIGTLLIGVLALLIGNVDILLGALLDLGLLIRDAFYFLLGFVLAVGNNVIDWFLTLIKVQDKKRPLTKEEKAMLATIFGDSLLYDAIRINEGNVGIMGLTDEGGATTMGYNIYFRSEVINQTLVHECVHVWQFQFGGSYYIGQSVVTQLLERVGWGPDPYLWTTFIEESNHSWYQLENVESQARFIQDVFLSGKFVFDDGSEDEDEGSFFREAENGHNEFFFDRENGTTGDFTAVANNAWTILRTA